MTIAEADDGEDVVRMVREKMGKGEKFDFILMDNIMVLYVAPNIFGQALVHLLLCFAYHISVEDAWAPGGPHSPKRAQFPGRYHR